MSRRLLSEEEVGSTSSSGSERPMAESREAQNTTSAPSQQGSAAKVKHHELYEPNCGTSFLPLNIQCVRFKSLCLHLLA